MSNSKIIPAISEIAYPLVEKNGLELVDVEYAKQGNSWVVRIVIDKPDGISHDDCEVVSKGISVYLDEMDLVEDAYLLEVSSPGIERPLKKREDYLRFAGKLVLIRTFAKIDGKKEFVGELLGLDEDVVKIMIEEKEIEIPLNQIAKANLTIDF